MMLFLMTSQPYSEAMATHPAVTYTPYDTPPKEKTDDIIMLTQFEEKDLWSETCDNAESSDGYDGD